MPDRQPWQCPACKGWVAPDVDVHWCDPDGGVRAKRDGGPKRPPAIAGEKGPELAAVGDATSITWTFPPGTTVTTTEGRQYERHPPQPVTITATLDGRAIFEAVQQKALLYRVRNAMGSAERGRREPGGNPWGLSAG